MIDSVQSIYPPNLPTKETNKLNLTPAKLNPPPNTQVAFTLPSELQVFFRERVAGVNRVSSYLLSHAMAALAFLLAWTALNVAVMFPAALNGLGFTQFAIFFATVSLSNVCSTALGYLVAVLAQNEAVALALGAFWF